MKYKLTMNGLDCAHCAAKVERAIAETEGFEEVSLVFATKSLYFRHAHDDDITSIVQKITDSVEDGVTVTMAGDHHEHSHEHHHEHNHEHGHEHHHEHGSSKLSIVMLAAAIALAVSAFILELTGISDVAVALLSAAAIGLSGYKVCLSGVKAAIKLQLDETTLMTIAVIAAFCLGQFVEGAMVTILYGIGEMFEDRAVDSSRRSIEKLANIQADTANITVNGALRAVPAEEVAVGTEITIKPHERIPLDCVVTQGEGGVDTSAITGESMPVFCREGSELLSGMLNGDTLLKARTTKVCGDSTAARIIKLVEEASVSKSNNEKLITRFARFYTPIVVLISLAIALIPPIFLGNIGVWIYRGLVCLVASCPCAIVISVPLAYYSGIGAASKKGVLIKGGRYLEALAAADTVLFDKTGTLTEGQPKVTEVRAYRGYSEDEVLRLAAGCERNSAHPIAKAITESCRDVLPDMTDYTETAGHGVSAVYNGKRIHCGGSKLLAESGIKNEHPEGGVFVIYDNEVIGSITVSDKLRAEAPDVVAKLRKSGVKRLGVLTGDSKENTALTCGKLGLETEQAQLLPQEKLSFVNNEKQNGRTVAFVGDGINDAPVIAAADCGIAMGLGSDAAIASADAVLTSGNLTALPTAFKIAKRTVATAKTNIIFALLIKASVITLAFFGLAAIWMSVLADTGVCMLCVLWAMRLLRN